METNIKRHFAFDKTPAPASNWKNSSEESRRARVLNALSKNKFYENLEVVSAPKDGRVVVRTLQNIPSSKRGLFYLGLESFLKKDVDEGITIWCEPLGDKSKLRNLRGVSFENQES